MTAYMVVIDTEVTDPEGLASLSDRLVETVEAQGGKYLIRGGAIEAKGGAINPVRMAVAEFDSIDQINALFNMEAFMELRELRGKFAEANAFIVEGV